MSCNLITLRKRKRKTLIGEEDVSDDELQKSLDDVIPEDMSLPLDTTGNSQLNRNMGYLFFLELQYVYRYQYVVILYI